MCYYSNSLRVNPIMFHLPDILYFLSYSLDPPTDFPKSSHQQTEQRRRNKAYLWPRSKCWIRASRASIQHAATKVTNMLYFFFAVRQLCQLCQLCHCLRQLRICILRKLSQNDMIFKLYSMNFPLIFKRR